jgi:hypothetical protein
LFSRTPDTHLIIRIQKRITFNASNPSDAVLGYIKVVLKFSHAGNGVKTSCILPAKWVQFAEICREIDCHSKKGKADELLEMNDNRVVGREGIEPSTY